MNGNQKDQPKVTTSLRGPQGRGNPFSSVPLIGGRAVLCTAGDADCHVALLLAMTEVDDGWSCCFLCGEHRGDFTAPLGRQAGDRIAPTINLIGCLPLPHQKLPLGEAGKNL